MSDAGNRVRLPGPYCATSGLKRTPCHYLMVRPSLLAVFMLIVLIGCTPQRESILLAKNVPGFQDDGCPKSLEKAVANQLAFLEQKSPAWSAPFGTTRYKAARLVESLQLFSAITDNAPTPKELDRLLRENFLVYQAGGRQSSPGEMLVTGYFTPVLPGSLEKEPPYRYPLYRVPDDLITRENATGPPLIGRLGGDNRLVPYYTREEIDSGSLLSGNELVYLKNQFDAFLLHVQGSGWIALPNGEIRSIQYRANNGHPYSSIGKLLVDEGKLSLEEADIPGIKNYLATHPEDVSRVLNHNRRYIFFGWGEQEEVRGSIGRPLTQGRSIALDGETLPFGTIAYLVTRRPELDSSGNISGWVKMHRFVFPQDTGAAIKGPGRVDVFWGAGRYAETAAGAMKEQGKLYFLVKKDGEGKTP